MKKAFEFVALLASAVLISSLTQTQPALSATGITVKQFQSLKNQVDALSAQLDDANSRLDDTNTSLEDQVVSLESLSSRVGPLEVGLNAIKSSSEPLAKKVFAQTAPFVYQVECSGGLGSAWGIAIKLNSADTLAGYQGAVVTNYHVVANCLGAAVRVSQNGRTLGGKVENWDQANDLALIMTIGTINALPISAVTPVRGDFAMTLGSPYGLEGSISQGIVSNLNGDYVVTDAAIDPGNSGGPLLNAAGELIGINTWKYVGSQGSGNAIKPGVLCRAIIVCASNSNLLAWSK